MPPPIFPSLLTYYTNNDERQRHSRQQLEFAITLRYLGDLIEKKNSPLNILEIGAGAGFYTQWMLEKGHSVTAIEPVPRLVDELKRLKEKHGNRLSVIQSDETAIYLLNTPFDLVLLMGPLYHLFDFSQRQKLLEKSHRLLADGGLVFSIFLSRIGYLSYLLKNDPAFIFNKIKEFQDVLTNGHENQPTKEGVFHGHFDKLYTVLQLYKNISASIQFVASLDPLIGPFDELYNNLSEPLKNSWLEIAYHLSLWPESLGSARTWAICSRANAGENSKNPS